MREIVVATNNAHKADEIKAVFSDMGCRVLTLAEAGIESDPAEDADSFEGNARIKARAAYAFADGRAVLADDSGLEVDALGGQPGVHSARYAGDGADDEANNALLLGNLADVAEGERKARFVCTMVFIDEAGSEIVTRGTVEGRIGHEPHGDNGFGYDPLFYPDEMGGNITFAEVPQQRKNEISHRARALSTLKDKLV